MAFRCYLVIKHSFYFFTLIFLGLTRNSFIVNFSVYKGVR